MRIHYGSIPTVLKKEHTCSLEPICSHHYARCAWGPSHLNSYILSGETCKRETTEETASSHVEKRESLKKPHGAEQ